MTLSHWTMVWKLFLFQYYLLNPLCSRAVQKRWLLLVHLIHLTNIFHVDTQTGGVTKVHVVPLSQFTDCRYTDTQSSQNDVRLNNPTAAKEIQRAAVGMDIIHITHHIAGACSTASAFLYVGSRRVPSACHSPAAEPKRDPWADTPMPDLLLFHKWKYISVGMLLNTSECRGN